MPTYICRMESSDQTIGSAGANDLFKLLGKETATAQTFVVSGSAQINVHFITPQGTPSSDAWESGSTMTCELRVTAATTAKARCQIRRCNAVGTVVQTGTFTAFQNISAGGTFTFTPTVPTWTAGEESCGNRLMIRFNFDIQAPGLSYSATIEVNTTNSEVVSTITEDTGNCRRIFVS